MWLIRKEEDAIWEVLDGSGNALSSYAAWSYRGVHFIYYSLKCSCILYILACICFTILKKWGKEGTHHTTWVLQK